MVNFGRGVRERGVAWDGRELVGYSMHFRIGLSACCRVDVKFSLDVVEEQASIQVNVRVCGPVFKDPTSNSSPHGAEQLVMALQRRQPSEQT